MERCQGKIDRAGEKGIVQCKISEKEENRGDRCQNIPLLRKDMEARKFSTDRVPFPKTVGQTVGQKLGAMEKGKERWIRKLKSKPARFPSPKGGISIGVGRFDRFSQSIEDSS
jgi:hypothetical protein